MKQLVLVLCVFIIIISASTSCSPPVYGSHVYYGHTSGRGHFYTRPFMHHQGAGHGWSRRHHGFKGPGRSRGGRKYWQTF